MMDEQNPDEAAPQEFVINEADLGQLPQELLGNAELPPMPEAGPIGVPDAGAAPTAALDPSAAPTEAMAGLPEGDLPDPNENPDPALAVAEMLAAALPDADAILPDVSAAPEGAPGFRVVVNGGLDAKREALKAPLTALGLDPSQSSFSRLTEFQAVRLLLELRQQGLSAHVALQRPDAPLSEEDLALGELQHVVDPVVLTQDGAPAVTLPGHEKDVMLCSGEAPTGFFTLETHGIVSAHRSIARRFFREEELQEQMERELQRYPSKGILPKSSIDKLFRELFADLQKRALGVGANAVLSVRIDCFPETTHLDPGLEQMRLVALGTAAVVEKAL